MNKMKMVVALGACVIAGFVMALPAAKVVLAEVRAVDVVRPVADSPSGRCNRRRGRAEADRRRDRLRLRSRKQRDRHSRRHARCRKLRPRRSTIPLQRIMRLSLRIMGIRLERGIGRVRRVLRRVRGRSVLGHGSRPRGI